MLEMRSRERLKQQRPSLTAAGRAAVDSNISIGAEECRLGTGTGLLGCAPDWLLDAPELPAASFQP